VPGSVFGFTATSCVEDFLGMRYDIMAFVGANGLLVVAVDGLVNLAANSGGEVTGVLLRLTPGGPGRVRFFSASFVDDGIALGVGVGFADAVDVNEVADDADAGCSWPG
jgi:hypothetical protein